MLSVESLLNLNFSWFSDIQELPYKEAFSIERQFKDDDCEHKFNFAFPCYHDVDGSPWVLPVVRTAEAVLAKDYSLSKEYLHPLGYDSFNKSALILLLGEQSTARVENRAFAIQTISATGAIRVGAEFLVECLNMSIVYNSKETTDDLTNVFLKAGFKECKEMRYINHQNLTLDREGLIEDLRQAIEGSVVILQVSGHNPTGYDPAPLDWEIIAEICSSRKLYPFFYAPFQGFATGNIDDDVAAVRLFDKLGIEFMCAQSFAWTFGLYNERAGALSMVVNNINKVTPIKTHLLDIAGSMYSTPPSHGARIVAFVLGDKILMENWTDTIFAIAKRLKEMRMYLREELERLGTPGSWCHITNQAGIFCFTGLSDIQVEHLKKQYHVYLLNNGRLNISGLNLDNIEYVAKAIYETLTIIPPSHILSAMYVNK